MLDPHHLLPAATTRETSEKDYMPAKDEDGPVAMLWELLRRNPRFKATFAKFKAIAHRGTSEGIRSASHAVRKIAAFNPFAAYTLIWIFAPKFVEFEGYRRQVNYRKHWTVSDWIDSGYPSISEPGLIELEDLLETYYSSRDESKPGEMPIAPMSLETPWPATPALFKWHFQWLWREFAMEVDQVAERGTIPWEDGHEGYGVGWFNPNVDWDKILTSRQSPSQTDLFELGRMRAELETHLLLTIPKLPLTKGERTEIVRKVERLLQSQFDAQNQYVSAHGINNLLGTEEQWGAFLWIQPRITYLKCCPTKAVQTELRYQSTGLGRALEEYLAAKTTAGKRSVRSKDAHHAEANYRRMEGLLFSVFPKFDWKEILIRELSLDTRTAASLQQRASSMSRKKLETLARWHS